MTFQCAECGLNYVEALADDRRKHRLYHGESVDGLQRHPLPTDVIIWRSETKRILVVTSLSSWPQRRRAQDLSLLAARDMPFSGVAYNANDAPDERNLHIFIGAESLRLVAYLAFEKRTHIGRCTWPQWSAGEVRELSDHAPMWSVGVVWVCRARRRQGWVRRLLLAATSHLGVLPDHYGWFTPFSESGEAVARSLCPEVFFIAK
jgi:hypothetical protein